MKVAWVKISGWPDSYSERMDELAKTVEELLVVRVRRLDGNDLNKKWRLKEIRPGRKAYLKPRIKVLLYPLWVLLGGLLLAHEVRKDEYDIIHAANYPFDALAGTIAKLLTGVPLVVSVRGLQIPRYDDNRDRVTGLKNRFAKFTIFSLNKVSLLFADGIVTKAEYQQKYLQDTYNSDVPMVSIPTGVDFEKFDPEETEPNGTVEELVEKDYEHIFLHLGKLVPGKGVDKLIERISHIENDSVGFLLIGDFQNKNFSSFIKNRINELGIGNRVVIHNGKIPYEEVPAVLNEVDGVCLLSRPGVEGIPRVLQEAVVMETPIVATDVEGIKGEFEGARGCYLIDPDNPQEFTKIYQPTLSLENPDRDQFKESLSMIENYSKYKGFYSECVI